MHYNGQGVPKDLDRAHTAYLAAALQGHARSQIMIGRMYALGEGVPQDLREAYFWLVLAEPQEPNLAACYFNKIGNKLPEADKAKVREDARDWSPRG